MLDQQILSVSLSALTPCSNSSLTTSKLLRPALTRKAMFFRADGSAPYLSKSLIISKRPNMADLMIGYPKGVFGDAPRTRSSSIRA
ncbi:hypothetical protein BC936DRAFT_145954 [Jimgerdemannia flammicorona]|uniref:Uncharacterized protein n=1 Tax=Jimgerdemannia flammicorona TaxID=994334 RepID=A0A433DLQ5_9FUNG|nr:hypothetical protein BC936DRAFT_145954 [Jimgerdemannia flammicorona]